MNEKKQDYISLTPSVHQNICNTHFKYLFNIDLIFFIICSNLTVFTHIFVCEQVIDGVFAYTCMCNCERGGGGGPIYTGN